MELQAQEAKRPDFKLPKPKKRRRWLVVLIVLAILAGLAFFLLQQLQNATANVLNSLLVPAEVTYRDITIAVSGAATVKAADSYTVTVLVKGEVLEAPFEEGQTVNKDDLLYRIDPGDAASSIRRSELSLERTRNSYNDLLKNIADTKSDIAKAQEDLILTTDDGGVIQKLYVTEGDTVMAGAQVAEILDRDNMLLDVPFHSAAAASFEAGQAAQVTIAGTNEVLSGSVTQIAYSDSAGPGGAVTRLVTIQVRNPGGLAEGTSATAAVGSAASAASGSFRYRTRTVVTAHKSGEIQTLHVREGGTVADGGALYTLDAAKAAETLQKQLESYEKSLRDTLLSIQDGEIALQSARDQLDNYTITSPISGTVIEKTFKAGDNVEATASGALAIVYDMSYLTFTMNIDELDIGKIKLGQTVNITADALSGQTFTGRVDNININGFTSGGVTSYPVTVIIDQAGELLPGMNVSADIMVENLQHVLTIPVAAVMRGDKVRVVGPDAYDKNGILDSTKLTEVVVTLGQSDENYIEVLSGLNEGDTVIIDNQGSSLMDALMGGGMGGMGGGMNVSTVTIP